MPAGIEQAVKGSGDHISQADRFCEQRLRCAITFEATSRRGRCGRVVALGIERWLPAARRGQGHLGAGVPKEVVGSCELLEPKPVFLPVSPSSAWEVNTISIFISLPHGQSAHYDAHARRTPAANVS